MTTGGPAATSASSCPAGSATTSRLVSDTVDTRSVPEVASHREDPRFGADRGEFWKSLRSLGPVVRINPVINPANAGYYITHRDDVLAALRDPETFASREYTFRVTLFGKALRQVPLSAGPNEHERFARALYPLFSPRAVAPYRAVVRAQAAALVEAIAPRGACDAVVDLGHKYPIGVLLTVCGLPPDDITDLVRADDKLPLLTHLLATADKYARHPQRPSGVVWRLFDGLARDNFPLDEPEVLGVLLGLFTAGFAGVSATVWHALLHLARDAQLRARLGADPQQIPAFAEEILRLETAAPTIRRVATRDVIIDGLLIPAGSRVWLCVESAGRQDGGELIATSDGSVRRQRHWGFGAGPHRCLGASLARVEIEALISEWLRQIPEFELEPGYTPSICCQHEEGPTTLAALPLRWDGHVG